MHRVELKDFRAGWQTCAIANVPNAPCGVESWTRPRGRRSPIKVPNAPCGVESVLEKTLAASEAIVPNAPCGVERHFDL